MSIKRQDEGGLRYLSEITDFINMLLQSQRFHLLIIQGPPGWGKSSITSEALQQLGVDFHAVGSYSTPLALFNTLVENDAATIVLDDTSGLFQNGHAMAILNAATWASASTVKGRRVTWTSATETAIEPEVIFRGKLIVLTNHLPTSPSATAFKTRALNYTLEVDSNGAAGLLLEAARSSKHFPNTTQSELVATFLADYAREYGPHRINLRTLEMGYDFASLRPRRWQELLMRALPKGNLSDLVKELENSNLSVEEQAARFRSVTGKSRRSFFYAREQIGLRKNVRTTEPAKPKASPKPATTKIRTRRRARRKTELKVVPAEVAQKPRPEVQYVVDD